MKKQSYQRILAVLISLMILLTAGMAIVGAGLLQTREDSPDILPEATATADSDELLMASDLAPDPAKWFLPYDGDLTDADGNPVRLSALRGKTTILLFWSSWCPDCHVYLAGDFGAAVQAAQAVGAQVVLVCREGIRGDTREKAEAELTECGITGIPLYMDTDAALFHTLGLRSVPSLAVFDSQGHLLRATADMPNADEIAQLLDAAQHPAQQTLAFLKRLMQADGAIPSTYTLSGGEVHPGDTVLSETMGQTMLYAVQTEDAALFSDAWRYVRDKMTVGGLTVWRIQAGEKAAANASLDDLRILRALMEADAVWGGYEREIRERAAALYTACVVDDALVSFANVDGSGRGDSVTLCYLDVQTMRALSAYDVRWTAVANRSGAILTDSRALMSSELPLYRASYTPAKDTFSNAAAQMTEAALTILHAAQISAAGEQTLDWLDAQLGAGAIYAQYASNGQVGYGFRYEAIGSYAVLAQVGAVSGHTELARLSLAKLENRRIATGTFAGAYGSVKSETSYTFDELEALFALMAMKP